MPTKLFHISRFSLVLVITALFCTQRVQAQYYDNHPPSINWRITRTEHFNVIFSEDTGKEASRLADLLEHYYKHNIKTMKPQWRKITVIMASESAVSNGYVSTMPYHSQLYNTPSSLGGVEWFSMLAAHEGRHMAQFNTINSESRKIYWYILGDQGAALYQGLTVPSWFLEGDAVLVETALTASGRGRTPVFDMYIRTDELSRPLKKRPGYYRAYFGDYNDNQPYNNHYVLGYHMVTYGRVKYGPMVWNDTLKAMGETTLLFDHFDSAFKYSNSSGNSMKEHYTDTYNYLRQQWQEQLRGLNFTSSTTLTSTDSKRWNAFTQLHEYRGHLYALEGGKDTTARLVEIGKNKKSYKLKQVPYANVISAASLNERSLSIGGNRAVWIEGVSDIRWGYRSYAAIAVMDLKSSKKERLFPRGKFTSAAISKDGNRIAAVEFSDKRSCSLMLIDTNSGSVIRRTPSPDNTFLFDPSWSDSGKDIVFSALNEKGSALLLYNYQSRTFRELIPYTNEEHPKSPVMSGRHVIYESDYSGINNIYALDLRNGRRYQVTSRKYGAFYPSVSENGKNLYYSDYTAQGYAGQRMPFDPSNWTPLSQVPVHRSDFIEPVVKQEAGKSIAEDVAYTYHSSESYSPIMNSVNIHSWIPLIPLYSNYWGLQLISDDYLETTSLSLYYQYNTNEKAHTTGASLLYSGLYPIFQTGVTKGQRISPTDTDIHWNENSAYVTATLPFNFSRGIHTTGFELYCTNTYTEISDKNEYEYSWGVLDDGSIYPVTGGINISHQVEGTSLDIYPRWGQYVNAYYSKIVEGDYNAEQYGATSAFFFPSIFHHSIHFNINYENNMGDVYRFPLNFVYPRGYDELPGDQIYMGSANYSLPLANLSLPIWKLLYFKRLVGSLYYDYSYINGDKEYYRRSSGGQLFLQYHPFSNKNIELESGVVYSRRYDAPEDENQDLYTIIILQVAGTF